MDGPKETLICGYALTDCNFRYSTCTSPKSRTHHSLQVVVKTELDDHSICIVDQKMLTPSPTNMRRLPHAQHHFQEWMSFLKKSRVPLPTGKKLLESSIVFGTDLLVFEEVISYRRNIQVCSKYDYWAIGNRVKNVPIPYSWLFSWGANFGYFHD